MVIPHTGKGSQFRPDKVFRHHEVVNGLIDYFSHIFLKVIFGPEMERGEGRGGQASITTIPFFCYAYVLVRCILNTEIMSSPFGDKRSYLVNLLMWLGIYLGISLASSLIFDFPLSLIAFLLAFILIQIGRGYIRQRKEGGIKFRNFFSPQSSSMYGFKPVNYYCMNCGTKHNDRECPNCGSRMKRVG